MTEIAIVHDYLTQRGGAERVVLSILKAFPEAPLYTSLFLPSGTFPEFRTADVHPLRLNRFSFLRRNHRFALPLLARGFSNLEVDADVVLCSSSGWAHGVRTNGHKIVYCHTPARWLYQKERYLGSRAVLARTALKLLRSRLVAWDRNSAASAQRYITQSTVVRDRIRTLYGIESELLPAPVLLNPEGDLEPIPEVAPGFFLSASRMLPYKNVDAIVAAFNGLPEHRLVVVGTGPDEKKLRSAAGRNVTICGAVSDQQLRWLYANTAGLVAASYEDYGLTTLEAAAHGKPTIALRWGGFVDTVIEGKTGVFFDHPTPGAIQDAIQRLAVRPLESAAIRAHASKYSEENFVSRLRAIIAEVVSGETVTKSTAVSQAFTGDLIPAAATPAH